MRFYELYRFIVWFQYSLYVPFLICYLLFSGSLSELCPFFYFSIICQNSAPYVRNDSLLFRLSFWLSGQFCWNKALNSKFEQSSGPVVLYIQYRFPLFLYKRSYFPNICTRFLFTCLISRSCLHPHSLFAYNPFFMSSSLSFLRM